MLTRNRPFQASKSVHLGQSLPRRTVRGTWLRGLATCLAVAVALPVTAPAIAAEAPTITQALFEKPHISTLNKGTTVTYDFKRKASEPKLLGANFEDKISIAINDVVDDKRIVSVKVFTGDRERDERVITGLTGNPVLVFFLDRAVANFSLLAGGNRAYHKNRFRVAMRTEGGLQPVTFKYEGKDVAGFRLAIRPFTGDRKNVEKMKGYENAEFTFLMSEAVPGYFAKFTAHYSSPLDGSPSLDETISVRGLDAASAPVAKAETRTGDAK